MSGSLAQSLAANDGAPALAPHRPGPATPVVLELVPAAAAGGGFAPSGAAHRGFGAARREAGLLVVLSLLAHAAVTWQVLNAPRPAQPLVTPPKVPTMVDVALLAPPPPPPDIIEPPPVAEPPPPRPPRVLAPKPAPKPKPKPAVKPPPKPIAEPPPPVVQAPPPAAPPPPPVLTQPRADADYLRNPAPVYPPRALRYGWQGRVLMKVEVLPDGSPGAVDIAQSSGRSVLDDAALEAVRRWTFEPARRGDTPIAGWVTVSINFQLED